MVIQLPILPQNWQDRVLSAIAGMLLGVVVSQGNHGTRLDAIERSVERIEKILALDARIRRE